MQDELLKLQSKHLCTIVFISHDLDEAMRIGDRIAIMQDGELIQVGCPDEILNNPANDYVRAFFRGVDLANVFSARDVASRRQIPLIKKHATNGPVAALKQLEDQDREFGYVIDRSERFIGVVSIESLEKAAISKRPLDEALLEIPQPILADTPVNELIGLVAGSPCQVPVVDNDGFYVGLISKANLLQHSIGIMRHDEILSIDDIYTPVGTGSAALCRRTDLHRSRSVGNPDRSGCSLCIKRNRSLEQYGIDSGNLTGRRLAEYPG